MSREIQYTLGACVALLLAVPNPVRACGGMFCNTARPVNQSAERIIFAHRADGGVTAVIEIQYQGPSERFAWVLPVTGSPEVGISSEFVLDQLQRASNPQYILNTVVEGECSPDFPGRAPAADNAGGVALDGGAQAPTAVTVVNAGTVGPYDFAVISVDPAAQPRASVAIDWLQENGYDVDDASGALLEPYLAAGQNLLAFRLTKGNDSGSIRPVMIDFGPGMASIPIRPTAVAAEDDMGILVWVLGSSRAIPVNYRALELNEALIDWFSPGSTYGDVVNAAADEAGGQGFVTELAGPSAALESVVWRSDAADRWQTLRASSASDREFVFESIYQLGNIDGFRDVLSDHVTLPETISLDEFIRCPDCSGLSETEIVLDDRAAYLAAIQTSVVDPILATKALFAPNTYVTRLYTTMSAAEMTKDPMFDFNSDLPEISNVHNADRIIECSPDVSQFDAPWRVTLDSGVTVRGTGVSWPLSMSETPMPANARILRLEPTGSGEVVTDNVAAIQSALLPHNSSIPSPTLRPRGGMECSLGVGQTGFGAWSMFALVGIVVLSRRRRT